MKTQNLNFGEPKRPENFEQKCLCTLVLDVSTSMQGNAIRILNQALSDFHQEILSDQVMSERIELSLVTFGSTVDVVQEPSLAGSMQMPVLTADGETALVAGVQEAIRLTHERKLYYKSTGQKYYRPFIILLTDGEPYPKNQDVAGLSNEIRAGVDNKGFVFIAAGVDGADFNLLRSLSHPQFPALKIVGLKLTDFFQWLSATLSTVTHSNTGQNVNIPAPGSTYAQMVIE